MNKGAYGNLLQKRTCPLHGRIWVIGREHDALSGSAVGKVANPAKRAGLLHRVSQKIISNPRN
jgi:hypothetical protein